MEPLHVTFSLNYSPSSDCVSLRHLKPCSPAATPGAPRPSRLMCSAAPDCFSPLLGRQLDTSIRVTAACHSADRLSGQKRQQKIISEPSAAAAAAARQKRTRLHGASIFINTTWKLMSECCFILTCCVCSWVDGHPDSRKGRAARGRQ